MDGKRHAHTHTHEPPVLLSRSRWHCWLRAPHIVVASENGAANPARCRPIIIEYRAPWYATRLGTKERVGEQEVCTKGMKRRVNPCAITADTHSRALLSHNILSQPLSLTPHPPPTHCAPRRIQKDEDKRDTNLHSRTPSKQ